MRIAIAGFKGEMPKANARALPPNYAQVARNVRTDFQTLAPLRRLANVHVFPGDVQTVFLDGLTWLGWNSIVNVARGPVAQERIYYTGDGAPKVRAAGVVYGLALAAPLLALTVTNLSAPAANPEIVQFTYTYVTSLGEESQPAPLSATIGYSPGVVQRLTTFSVAPGGRAITAMRIYRSQTSTSGATTLNFAVEVPVATTTYDYNAVTNPLNEIIRSVEYDPPPALLRGLTTMPNGMMAAFDGKDLYFCEPYIPHAWPEKYILTVDFPIVGLAAFGSNLAVLTTGTPYIVQGLTPDAMAMEKVESGYPCMSARSIVDIGYAALYASTEGLVMLTASESRILTSNAFSRDQWRELMPENMSAKRFDGQYVFLRNASPSLLYDCGDPVGWLDAETFLLETLGPVLEGSIDDYIELEFGDASGLDGDFRIGILNSGNEMVDFVDTDILDARSMFFDDRSSDLYLLRSDLRTVAGYETITAPSRTMVWRSKRFTSVVFENYGAAFVRTTRPISTDDVFQVAVIGDGLEQTIFDRANEIVRLKSEARAQEWEIEITSSVEVISFVMASTVDEVMDVLQ